MRGVFASIATTVAALAVYAPQAAAQAPAGDSVTGNLADVNGVSFEVNALSGPSGENATGAAAWNLIVRFFWNVDVTCLAVEGNTAVIGFSGSESGPLGEFSRVAGLVRIVDGGGPASAQDSVEWAQTSEPSGGNPTPGPTDCSSYPASFTPFSELWVNDSGNIVVVDAPALPNSKDQCKNGGWKRYGVFKNQGDCVSFVTTKGKNRPAG